MNEDIIKALVIIGNAKKVKKICEPNIMEPRTLEKWMVARTLKAVELFENEWRIYQNTRGTI